MIKQIKLKLRICQLKRQIRNSERQLAHVKINATFTCHEWKREMLMHELKREMLMHELNKLRMLRQIITLKNKLKKLNSEVK